jgi:hypothetical protein
VAKKHIFSIGTSLPSDDIEFVPYNTDITLDDADIIIFRPTIECWEFDYQGYGGKKLITAERSFDVKQRLNHWKSELQSAMKAGKLIIFYLAPPEEYYRYSGSKTYSGTGKSRVTTNNVEPVSSYDAAPIEFSVSSKLGKQIRAVGDCKLINSYWHQFSDNHQYRCEITGEFTPIFTSRTGTKTVGAVSKKYGGAVFLLPDINLDNPEFVETVDDGDEEWTDIAMSFGHRFVSELCSIHDALKSDTASTPPPDWSLMPEYRLEEEALVESKIETTAIEIRGLRSKVQELEIELHNLSTLRGLLFEQGTALEIAILEALRLFGFNAEPFAEGESEFDAVFSSAEGRYLGEAEGRDNAAIGIAKFQQLERNIQEDFARDEVQEHAKAVLFGNAFRLTELNQRKEFFTEKCRSASKRVEAALVRTPDLFDPARYLKTHPGDLDYAASCRKAIAEAKGTVVVFPKPPCE